MCQESWNVTLEDVWERFYSSTGNSSEVLKSNFDYYQRVAYKKLSFIFSLFYLFPAGAPFSDIWCYSRSSPVELTKVWISLKSEMQTGFCKKIKISHSIWNLEWHIKCPYLVKNSGKNIGLLGQNLAKSGQRLEKVSQPRGLRFHWNKYDFLKLE